MNHEPTDKGSDGSGKGPGSGHDVDPAEESSNPSAQDRDERGSNSVLSSRFRAIGEADDEVAVDVESVDDAIDAEIVDGSPHERLRAVMSQWSGNLPHPDDAERYERIAPGTLDRLIALDERRIGVVEREVDLAETREQTVRTAVEASSDVRRVLADADTGALRRGQWQSFTLSLASLGAVIFGLSLGYPQALWGLGVPIVQAGAVLVRTVTQAQEHGGKSASPKSGGGTASADDPADTAESRPSLKDWRCLAPVILSRPPRAAGWSTRHRHATVTG